MSQPTSTQAYIVRPAAMPTVAVMPTAMPPAAGTTTTVPLAHMQPAATAGSSAGTQGMGMGMSGTESGMPAGGMSGGMQAHKSMATPMTLMTVPDSVISIIVKEHEMIKNLHNNYHARPLTDLTERENLAAAIIKNISIHLFLEENVLYPCYIALLGEAQGKIAHKHSSVEHQKLKEYLHQADECFNVRDPSFHARLEESMNVFNHHCKEEENDFLVQLQERTPLERLKELGKDYESKRSIAPTRPHPTAGAAGASTIGGIITKAGDALRDAASGRGAMAGRAANKE